MQNISSQECGNVPIHIHPDAISVLETGDFYSTWANRYDSDMPSTACEPISQGDSYNLGDGEIIAISLPGHCTDGMGYFEKERKFWFQDRYYHVLTALRDGICQEEVYPN